MFEFNLKGLLIPETIIPSTLDEFKNEFVVKLKEGNREELFIQYQLYCKDIKEVCGSSTLTQWIDGSYTTKNKNPSDIDLVTLINYETVKTKRRRT